MLSLGLLLKTPPAISPLAKNIIPRAAPQAQIRTLFSIIENYENPWIFRPAKNCGRKATREIFRPAQTRTLFSAVKNHEKALVFRSGKKAAPKVFGLVQTRTLFSIVENYEKALIFRSGKHHGEKEPGFRWSFPVFNELRKVDMRTRTMQIPSQELITKDNVTIHVDGVAFYGVVDALKSLCYVEDLEIAVSEAVQTSVRDQLSQSAFSSVLHDRESAGKNILSALCSLTVNWGVLVDAVKLKNIRVDESMIRAMGRVAEAERVRAARLIEASAELDASKKLVQAGKEFGSGDGILGLKLREMQNHAQIAAEKNTTMMIIPAKMDATVARSLKAINQYLEHKESNQPDGEGQGRKDETKEHE